ncbi:MAG TPA: tetratricopeptide repeat protein [bacterium (Candidatus Stahlbacteria)]|nr:tetratricopeptide repeat protein [Candidatus Stahlbacteria bacterium]
MDGLEGGDTMKGVNNFLLSVLVLSFTVLLTGCATVSIRVPFTEPAEIDLKGIENIAIGDITGYGGKDLQDELTQALFESERFQVLDRQHLDHILTEHELQYSGAIDESTAIELGKLIGSTAFIFGRVQRYDYNEQESHSRWKDKKTGKTHINYKRKGVATVRAFLQVTDTRTGKIIAIKKIERMATATTSATDRRPQPIDSDALLESARLKVIDTFMRAIAPYEVMIGVTFVKVKGVPEISAGIAFAKHRQWDLAIESFEKGVETTPYKVKDKAHYNLGIAYMAIGEFNKAKEHLKEAMRLNPKSKRYAKAFDRCKYLEEESKKLEEQLKE